MNYKIDASSVINIFNVSASNYLIQQPHTLNLLVLFFIKIFQGGSSVSKSVARVEISSNEEK